MCCPRACGCHPSCSLAGSSAEGVTGHIPEEGGEHLGALGGCGGQGEGAGRCEDIGKLARTRDPLGVQPEPVASGSELQNLPSVSGMLVQVPAPLASLLLAPSLDRKSVV